MKAVFITRFGRPEVLKIREIPRPEPAPGEVLVRVRTIGLNFAEVFARLGVYPGIPDPPFVPGIECSGIIESIGKEVKSVKPGDRVMVFSKQGTYADFVCTREEFVVRMPSRMSFSLGAALMVTYCSAYHGLITLANLRRGDRVLIHAGAGGVGSAAIQVAKLRGAEVFATVGSDEKLDVALSQGADHAVNYRSEDFSAYVKSRTGGYGLDVIMDSVAGAVFQKGWKLLAPMGRYVIFGFASVTGRSTISRIKALGESLRMPLIFPPSLVSKNISLAGFNLYFLAHKHAYIRGIMKTILRWHAEKKIRPLLGRTFPFHQVVEAHSFLQSRKSIGKVLIDMHTVRPS